MGRGSDQRYERDGERERESERERARERERDKEREKKEELIFFVLLWDMGGIIKGL